jgi:nucleoside-diphosphate-sugar epimerase
MSPLTVTSRPNLIVGCGYLGRRVARRWLGLRRRVIALTRRNSDELAALGIEPIIGDVLHPPALPEAVTVLYAVGFDRAVGAPMRDVYITGLGNILDVLPPSSRFLYISSTSVYGQTDGEWVDESTATEPIEGSGQIVLESERLLCGRRPDAIVLRFGGIYGPDRLLRRRSQLSVGEPMSGDPARRLNLIHVDDGADAVLAAEEHGTLGETYNIVDDEPVTRLDYYAMLAELTRAPPPRFDNQPEARASNRRVSNKKAKDSLRWRPSYPSCREGLPAALGEPTT